MRTPASLLVSTKLLRAYALVLVAGCAASGTGFDSDADGGATDGGSSGQSSGFGGSSGLPKEDASKPEKTLLYAHTDTSLFELDPENVNAAPVALGDFDCVSGGGGDAMTDIGVTKAGKIYGVSQTAAYPLSLQTGKVHCDDTWTLPTGSRFYGLTVAPENTVAKEEVLIAVNVAGELYQVDANTGRTTQVGTLGKDSKGEAFQLSGDVVFLANKGNPIGFATVRTCPKNGTCSAVDTLIEVNVAAVKPGTQSVLKGVRGTINKGSWCGNAASPKEFGSLYGIAAYQEKVFGFSRAGEIVEIRTSDSSACLVSTITGSKFAGAGVTTSAPVIAPQPK